ncbi:hypothetical protein R5R35_005677 [Gryllus longicercus]|uniref:Enoyl reductase (ER) domain-containing protein n=1 Tax=Gryllus longicercus TaxID=2509291 RepID=A0AAN9VRX4_9ORTH
MDEVLFHASESVEALQVQLLSRFQQGRELLLGYAEHLNNLTNTPVAQQLQNTFNQAWIVIQRFLNEIKDVAGKISNPQQFLSRILPILGFDGPSISVYYGSVGFLLGVGVGVLVGLSCRRQPPAVQKMCAVVCTSYAGVDAVTASEDIHCPQIHNSDEVMVQVKAASVDPVDVNICSGYGRVLRRHLGRYNANVVGEFPVILGRDCAGVVVEIGQKVNNFELGDEVWFSVPYWASGVLAEYVVVKQNLLAHKPKGITFEVAASLPYSGMLAWDAMVHQAGLNSKTCRGRRVLVHTGCSAIGCLLVQLAHLWGAHVTVTCPLRATPVAQALGADCIIVCGEGGDIEKQLLQTDLFDVVFNTVGKNAHEMCLKFCRDDGRVITTIAASLPSDTYGFFIGILYSLFVKMRCLTWRLFGASVWTSAVLNPSVLENLGAMVETGGLQPVVDKIFMPQDAELAFQHVEQGDSIGKTVIRFRLNQRCRCGAYPS